MPGNRANYNRQRRRRKGPQGRPMRHFRQSRTECESRSPSSTLSPIGAFHSTKVPNEDPAREPFDHFVTPADGRPSEEFVPSPNPSILPQSSVIAPGFETPSLSPPTIASFEIAVDRMHQGLHELESLSNFLNDLTVSVRGIAKSVGDLSESSGLVRESTLVLKRCFSGDPIMLALDAILTESVFLNRVFDLLADDINENIGRKLRKAIKVYQQQTRRLEDQYDRAVETFMVQTQGLQKVTDKFHNAHTEYTDILTRYRHRYPTALDMPTDKTAKLARAERHAIAARNTRLEYIHDTCMPVFDDFSATVLACWGTFAEIERGRYATQRNMVIRITRVLMNRSVALEESIENLRVVAGNPHLRADTAVNNFLKQIIEPDGSKVVSRVHSVVEANEWAETIVQFGRGGVAVSKPEAEEEIAEAEEEEEEEEEEVQKIEPQKPGTEIVHPPMETGETPVVAPEAA